MGRSPETAVADNGPSTGPEFVRGPAGTSSVCTDAQHEEMRRFLHRRVFGQSPSAEASALEARVQSLGLDAGRYVGMHCAGHGSLEVLVAEARRLCAEERSQRVFLARDRAGVCSEL